jgi:hypothetical protein
LRPRDHGRTGTRRSGSADARYGPSNPLPTDAWLVGFNNEVLPGPDVAFAMVTVNGGEGRPVDGPVVAKFLNLLQQSGG